MEQQHSSGTFLGLGGIVNQCYRDAKHTSMMYLIHRPIHLVDGICTRSKDSWISDLSWSSHQLLMGRAMAAVLLVTIIASGRKMSTQTCYEQPQQRYWQVDHSDRGHGDGAPVASNDDRQIPTTSEVTEIAFGTTKTKKLRPLCIVVKNEQEPKYGQVIFICRMYLYKNFKHLFLQSFYVAFRSTSWCLSCSTNSEFGVP